MNILLKIIKGVCRYMTYYFQRERNIEDSVNSDSIVKFNIPITISETTTQTSSEDFNYNEDGSIEILRSGIYTISWFISQMTGLSTGGQAFALKKFNYDEQVQDWEIMVGSSNHVKIASSFGFGTVDISEEEIETYEKVKIALFNITDKDAKLTNCPNAKAGILIFGNDLLSLEKRLSDLYEQLYCIEQFLQLSNVSEAWSPTIELSGTGVAVISSGYTFNFWGIGALNHQQTLNSMTTYYLINNNQYEKLDLYQGEATIGTLWVETPFGETYSLPIRFDNTGVYFTPYVQLANLPVGTTFKFTQSLILVDPDGGILTS